MKVATQVTMARVKNYGSVLQAYALQHVVQSIPGWRCETIDYRPWERKKKGLKGWLRLLANYMRYGERSDVFGHFVSKRLNMTRPYYSFDELMQSPPRADVYVTGSDQTFNPRFTNCDPTFFLKFVPKGAGRKIAYAPSVAQESLLDEHSEVFRRAFDDYDALSARESVGAEALTRLSGRKVAHCCDPTLLLTRDEWAAFSRECGMSVKQPYILVYNLTYMVDPYPKASAIEERVQDALHLPIYYLGGTKRMSSRFGSKILKRVTVEEFVWLFLHATFTMTSSFHGTAFALQGGNPFVSYVKGRAEGDSRLADLLRRCGAEQHMIDVDGESIWDVDLVKFDPLPETKMRMREFRKISRKWLVDGLY